MELLIGFPMVLIGIVLWVMTAFAIFEYTVDEDTSILGFSLGAIGLFLFIGGFPLLWSIITFLLITYPAILLFPVGIALTAGAGHIYRKTRPEPEEPRTLEYYAQQKKLDAAQAFNDWDSRATDILASLGVQCCCRASYGRDLYTTQGRFMSARAGTVSADICPLHSWETAELAQTDK